MLYLGVIYPRSRGFKNGSQGSYWRQPCARRADVCGSCHAQQGLRGSDRPYSPTIPPQASETPHRFCREPVFGRGKWKLDQYLTKQLSLDIIIELSRQ